MGVAGCPKQAAASRGRGAFLGRMRWNWVYEMAVITSGADSGQWYSGTEPQWVQTPLDRTRGYHLLVVLETG